MNDTFTTPEAAQEDVAFARQRAINSKLLGGVGNLSYRPSPEEVAERQRFEEQMKQEREQMRADERARSLHSLRASALEAALRTPDVKDVLGEAKKYFAFLTGDGQQ